MFPTSASPSPGIPPMGKLAAHEQYNRGMADASVHVPPNSAVELVSGGAKFVMQSTDILKVESDTASSADVYVSVVDSISA